MDITYLLPVNGVMALVACVGGLRMVRPFALCGCAIVTTETSVAGLCMVDLWQQRQPTGVCMAGLAQHGGQRMVGRFCSCRSSVAIGAAAAIHIVVGNSRYVAPVVGILVARFTGIGSQRVSRRLFRRRMATCRRATGGDCLAVIKRQNYR